VGNPVVDDRRVLHLHPQTFFEVFPYVTWLLESTIDENKSGDDDVVTRLKMEIKAKGILVISHAPCFIKAEMGTSGTKS